MMKHSAAVAKIPEGGKIPKKTKQNGLVDLSSKMVLPQQGKMIKATAKYVNKGYTAGAANGSRTSINVQESHRSARSRT